MASPRPVPSPTSFVVKNGSKMYGSVSAAMPRPLSVTDSLRNEPGRYSTCLAQYASSNEAWRVSIVICPIPAMASRELTHRHTIDEDEQLAFVAPQTSEAGADDARDIGRERESRRQFEDVHQIRRASGRDVLFGDDRDDAGLFADGTFGDRRPP